MNPLIVNQLEPSKILGVHGTSVEQVVEALRKGKFEREYFSRKQDSIKCDSIHFIANIEHFGSYFSSIGVRGSNNLDYEGMMKETKMWARDMGFRHYMAVNTNDTKPLGWHVVMWEMDAWPEKYGKGKPWDFEEIIRRIQPGGGTFGLDILWHIESQGISREQLYRHLEQGYQRKGCLVGLNEKCRQLRIERGDLDIDPEAQLYIPREGLSLEYVSGIIPAGEVERKILSVKV